MTLIVASVVGLATTAAKGCDAGSDGSNAKPSRLVAVKLETKGNADRQQIRYKVVPDGKKSSEVGWDLDSPFIGRHYKHTLFLKNGDTVIFHAVNHDDRGTYVRCVITAFKSEKAKHSDPAVASCLYIARTTPIEN